MLWYLYVYIGTHGCRAEYGNLATLVTKLKMVTGEGKIVTLTATDNNTELFRAAQVCKLGRACTGSSDLSGTTKIVTLALVLHCWVTVKVQVSHYQNLMM